MKISSTAFANESSIPAQYTCDGANSSPELVWTDVPEKTKSLTLIVDDPDAPSGLWTHWVVYNMSAESRGPAHQLPPGARQGKNSFDETGYGGPCPPKGHGSHRYFFRLYALDDMPNLPSGADSVALKAAMKDHVLETAELMGRYEH